jgi:hypothetical protein
LRLLGATIVEEIVFKALFIEANTHMVLEGEGIVIWGRVTFHGKAYILRSPSVRHGICLLALIHLMQGTTDIKTASVLNPVQNQHRYLHGH